MPMSVAAFEAALIAAAKCGITFEGLPDDPSKLNDSDRMAVAVAPFARFRDFGHATTWGKRIQLPPLPVLPPALDAVDWALSYDGAAPWSTPWWHGFWHAEEPCPYRHEANRIAWARGAEASRSKAAETYRKYVEKCRASLRAAGWPEDQIP